MTLNVNNEHITNAVSKVSIILSDGICFKEN